MDRNDQLILWRETLLKAENASRRFNTDKAETLYREALALSERELDSQEIVTSLIQLADFYMAHKLADRAEEYYRQALELYEQVTGWSSFISAMCLRSLSEALECQGKVSEAKEIMVRAQQVLATLR